MKKKEKGLGLWTPRKIMQIEGLSLAEKSYYAYIYSFAERGCWQTDAQIGKELKVSERTVQRYQKACQQYDLLKVTGKQSKYRRIWAKNHPKFITKNKDNLLRQTCQSNTTNMSELLRQKCLTTNTYTNTNNNKGLSKSEKITRESQILRIEQQSRKLGKSAGGLSTEEKEQRRQDMKIALLNSA